MSKTERQMESNTVTGTSSTDGQRSRHTYTVSSSPFAGRIGGNQDFVVTSHDDDAGEVLKKLPDAVSLGLFIDRGTTCLEHTGTIILVERSLQPARLSCEGLLANGGHRGLGYVVHLHGRSIS